VPVIKHADRLSITGIGQTAIELVQKVHNNQISVAYNEGGSFTVHNTGSFDSVLSQPLINFHK